MRLFDAHCHLQDRRIAAVAPQLIRVALDSGVRRFVVNGVSEEDWHIVKQMGDDYPSIVPCFGLHPWFIAERSPNWFNSLKEFLVDTPAAAVGEIGLHKGAHGKLTDFSEQVDVFKQQLELAKVLEKPVSVHCVGAFAELLDIMSIHVAAASFMRSIQNFPSSNKDLWTSMNNEREEEARIWNNGYSSETRPSCTGPFKAGVILHSYIGSAELVPGLAKLGSYFSFSGHLTSMTPEKAKKVVQSVPKDRILIETDAPDGLLRLKTNHLFSIPDVPIAELEEQSGGSVPQPASLSREGLNHPANIHSVLNYVATLLEMPEDVLAELSFQNACLLFSYPGSKVGCDG